MSKKYAIFITCLFAAFLGVFFAANAIAPDRDFSPMENRSLQQLPTLDMGQMTIGALQKSGNFFNAQFMGDFEDYVADQFVLRDAWIALKAGTETAMGKQENNGVYLCERDTLIAKFTAPATDTAIRRTDKNYEYVNTFAQKAGVPVYFSLIPGKTAVWADRLPLNAPNGDEMSFVTRAAQTTQASWIDLSAALLAHKDEDIFYRTDHHWTTLGAYYGYEALMAGMGLAPKPLAELPANVVSTEFFGTTFSSAGVRWVKPDAITLYVPQEAAASVTNYYSEADVRAESLYNMDQLAEKDKYSMFLGGNKPLTVLTSAVAPAGAPKLLVIRDSFSDSLAPFLLYSFSEVHLLDLRYNKNSPTAYVQEHGIDQVLVLYSVDNFVADGNLFALSR